MRGVEDFFIYWIFLVINFVGFVVSVSLVSVFMGCVFSGIIVDVVGRW